MKTIKLSYRKVQEFVVELQVEDNIFDDAVKNVITVSEDSPFSSSDIASVLLDQPHIDFGIKKSTIDVGIDIVDEQGVKLHNVTINE